MPLFLSGHAYRTTWGYSPTHVCAIFAQTSYQQRPQLEPLIPNVHTINELHPRPLLPSARPLSLVPTVPVYHLHETFVPRFQKCEKNRLIIGITIPITNALISNRDHSTLSRCKHSQQQQQLQPQLKALLFTLTGSLRRVITVVNNNKRAFATVELRESSQCGIANCELVALRHG